MNQVKKIILKAVLSIGVLFVGFYTGLFLGLILWGEGINEIVAFAASFSLAVIGLCFIWIPKRKLILVLWLIFLGALLVIQGLIFGVEWHKNSITINTSPNINTSEYLPFVEDSKIVKKDSQTLKLSDPLPRIDGAAALFPVYSAFVNATYPDTTALRDGVFEYRNTPSGYRALAE